MVWMEELKHYNRIIHTKCQNNREKDLTRRCRRFRGNLWIFDDELWLNGYLLLAKDQMTIQKLVAAIVISKVCKFAAICSNRYWNNDLGLWNNLSHCFCVKKLKHWIEFQPKKTSWTLENYIMKVAATFVPSYCLKGFNLQPCNQSLLQATIKQIPGAATLSSSFNLSSIGVVCRLTSMNFYAKTP